jgi:hypothetical protein
MLCAQVAEGLGGRFVAPYRQRVRCAASAKGSGQRCQLWAKPGALVCWKHGANAPQVAAKAAVRAEVMRWGLHDSTEDPGEILLRLVTQSAERVRRYSAELEELVAEKTLRHALVGTAQGEFGPTGEYIRGLAQLEAQERDRCANFCRLAITAGLAERQVRVAERQGQLLAELLRAVLADPALGLSSTQVGMIPSLIRQQLSLVPTK